MTYPQHAQVSRRATLGRAIERAHPRVRYGLGRSNSDTCESYIATGGDSEAAMRMHDISS